MNSHQEAFKRGYEFERLVERALPRIYQTNEFLVEPRFGVRANPDFLLSLQDGTYVIVEVKSVTPTTEIRINSVIAQLHSYADSFAVTYGLENPRLKLVLAVSETLAAPQIQRLNHAGIDVLDGDILRNAFSEEAGFDDELDGVENEVGEDLQSSCDQLVTKLDGIPAGRGQWSLYQSTVHNLLELLLCPPLGLPLGEKSNESKVNRRDIILPNYAPDGLWHYMRTHYKADFVVVDAKNSGKNVTKNNVLQIGNYLSSHGLGLFGMIVSRKSSDRAAEVTRREQWLLHSKMIIIVDDDDLKQMVELLPTDMGPSGLIRQKVEDFRMSI